MNATAINLSESLSGPDKFALGYADGFNQGFAAGVGKAEYLVAVLFAVMLLHIGSYVLIRFDVSYSENLERILWIVKNMLIAAIFAGVYIGFVGVSGA